MALFSQIFTALLLLQLELHLVGGSEAAPPQTLGCSASTGVPGTPGHNGLPGRDGRDGKDGATGPKGEKGEPGMRAQCRVAESIGEASENRGQQESDHCALISGPSVQGPPGKAGPVGPAGPPGPQGPKGVPGSPGSVPNDLIKSLQSEVQALKARLTTAEKILSFNTFRTVGQKLFMVNKMDATFDKGQKLCSDAGWTLAVPRTEAENKALSEMIIQLGASHAYIGATDREKEGQFVDVHKAPLTFTKWRKGEPNNDKKSEHCAGMYASGEWNDFNCDTETKIICETESA
ncbi:hypothetical protein AOLI_G00116700 [Acnodon oligacanthus]